MFNFQAFKMSVKIKKISDDEISANGKLVYKNAEGLWICKNLNCVETEVVRNYLAAFESKTSVLKIKS